MTERETPSDAVSEFLIDLGERGHVPALSDTSGVVALELLNGSEPDRWLIIIDKGNVSVDHQDGEAGCRLLVDRSLFERLIRGETDAMAAVLRGAATPVGNLELLLALQRVLPGPPDQQRPAPIGRSTRWEP